MKGSERQQVTEFLERNVIGRTVVAEPITTLTNDGRTEASYVDENLFSNLVHTPYGFNFDISAITTGRRHGLGDDGGRAELAGTLDAVRVYRYEITERASSGKLVGFGRFISSSNNEFDPLAGTVFLVQMTLDGDELLIEESQVGYGDFVEPGGGRRPVACDFSYRYTVKDDRLFVTFQQATFDVDPDTLRRTPSNDKFPPQTSVEFDQPG